jgi:hypothetical protein
MRSNQWWKVRGCSNRNRAIKQRRGVAYLAGALAAGGRPARRFRPNARWRDPADDGLTDWVGTARSAARRAGGVCDRAIDPAQPEVASTLREIRSGG